MGGGGPVEIKIFFMCSINEHFRNGQIKRECNGVAGQIRISVSLIIVHNIFIDILCLIKRLIFVS